MAVAGPLVVLVAVGFVSGSGGGTASPAARVALERAYAKLPLAFEPNRGQSEAGTAFLARGAGYSIALRSSGAVFALGRRDRLSMKLRGANTRAALLPEQALPGRVNYLLGNVRSKWLTGIPTYARLRARNVYPGIDLAYYGRQGRFEYDFLVQPGASPEAISLSFAGARRIRLERNGNLSLKLPGGTLRQLAPRVYQQVDGKRRPVEARFLLRGQRVAFALGSYDRRRTLVIDPALVYSTYLGGTGDDYSKGVAVDTFGSAYLTGYTDSTNFPTAPASPLQPANAGLGRYDAFVTKLNAAGTALVYSTYLGGSGDDFGFGIAVDADGSAYLTGYTYSTNFPTASPLQADLASPLSDAFVAKLNAAGTALVYSTYLGGGGYEFGYGIAVDTFGSAYLTGNTDSTGSTGFPTAPASPLQAANAGGTDAFVAKLSAAGTALVYSTYLGGALYDEGDGIAVDSLGSAYVTGNTDSTGSTGFPTASPLQAANAGNGDAFVTKLDAAGTALVYSTYLGGSGYDIGFGIAVDAGGSAYLTGQTVSANFPTAPASPLRAALAGPSDAFVTKLDAAGTALVYSTYLGGSGDDFGYGIAVGTAGSAYLTGATISANFPTASPLQAANAGGTDAFVTKLNPVGTALAYSTYLGGSGDDFGYGIAVDASGSAYLTGYTFSTNFPTAPAIPLQAAKAGIIDAFVAKIGEGGPTAVSLRSFAASRSGRLVVVRWRTGSELSLLGFHVYRQFDSGRRLRLTRVLIHVASKSGGSSYSFRDRLPRASGSPRYWLEEVRLDGSRGWRGPIGPS